MCLLPSNDFNHKKTGRNVVHSQKLSPDWIKIGPDYHIKFAALVRLEKLHCTPI